MTSGNRVTTVLVFSLLYFALLVGPFTRATHVQAQFIVPTILIEPQMLSDAHGTFTVDVDLAGMVNCYGYDFRLQFNRTVLTLISADRPVGNFLAPLLNPNSYLVPVWKTNESVSGDIQTAHFAYTLLMPESGRDGDGTIVRLTFKAEAYGETMLFLHDSIIPNAYSGYVIVSTFKGDLNLDGLVDITDIVIVANAFGSTPESANWNHVADINMDGYVDIIDLVIVAGNFGSGL